MTHNENNRSNQAGMSGHESRLMTRRLTPLMLSALMLTACGGGSGDGSSETTASDQGIESDQVITTPSEIEQSDPIELAAETSENINQSFVAGESLSASVPESTPGIALEATSEVNPDTASESNTPQLATQCTTYTFIAYNSGDSSDEPKQVAFEVSDQFSTLNLVGDFTVEDLSVESSVSDLIMKVDDYAQLTLINYYEGLVPNSVHFEQHYYPGELFFEMLSQGKDPTELTPIAQDSESSDGDLLSSLDEETRAEYEDKIDAANDKIAAGLNRLAELFGVSIQDDTSDYITLEEVLEAFDGVSCD